MKIRIAKASHPDVWYAKYVGKEFEALVGTGPMPFVIPPGADVPRAIDSGDYEIIPEPNPSRPFDPVEWGFVENRLFDPGSYYLQRSPVRWHLSLHPDDNEMWIARTAPELLFGEDVMYSGSIPPTASDGEVLLRLLGIIGGER